MKTKTIPFDLETAKKIQAGEIEGKIKTRCGDKVRIVSWDSTARCFGFAGSTTPIIAQDEDEHLYSYFEDGCYIKGDEHPKDLVLEVPVNERQFKPFDKVLVRQSKDGEWKPRLYSYKFDTWHFCQDGTGYALCIPYDGNEHLAGTTVNPNEQ